MKKISPNPEEWTLNKNAKSFLIVQKSFFYDVPQHKAVLSVVDYTDDEGNSEIDFKSIKNAQKYIDDVENNVSYLSKGEYARPLYIIANVSTVKKMPNKSYGTQMWIANNPRFFEKDE